MNKKIIVSMLAALIPASVQLVEAQQPKKIAKIGYLLASTPAAAAHNIEAFRQGMRELGYVEGKTLVLEVRYGEARAERIAELARELVGLKVDVIVASTDVAIAAVKRETQTIPIVMAISSDPVGTGLVASLARPGGNVTGNSTISPELSGKRLELLMEAVPGLSRLAFSLESRRPGQRARLQRNGRCGPFAASGAPIRRSVPRRGFRSRPLGRHEPTRTGVSSVGSESRKFCEAGPDRKLRAEESAAVHVWTKGVRRRWRGHVLWVQRSRHAPRRCHVCG